MLKTTDFMFIAFAGIVLAVWLSWISDTDCESRTRAPWISDDDDDDDDPP